MIERPLHLDTKEAAARLGLSPITLEGWRVQGKGPRYLKIGRRVFYPENEIKAFLKDCLRSSTSEKKHG
jgi:predicted DNA-binding transcriptional regulator AlpA